MLHKNKNQYLNNRDFNSKIFSEKNKTNRLIKLARTGKYSVPQLSRQFGCSKPTVFKVLYSRGISIPNIGRFKKIYHYDENFFDELNPVSAYWAGFIAADGTLNNKNGNKLLAIGLSEKDSGHLNKFLMAINSDVKIRYVKSNRSAYIALYSKIMFDSLVRLGIEPNKSLTIHRVKIPKSLLTHFIRGVYDGDGAISGSRITHVQIDIAGNKPFLLEIQKALMKKCGVNKTKIYPLNNRAYKLQYTGSQIFRILNYLYKDSKPETRLNRKYEKYLRFKDRFNR